MRQFYDTYLQQYVSNIHEIHRKCCPYGVSEKVKESDMSTERV